MQKKVMQCIIIAGFITLSACKSKVDANKNTTQESKAYPVITIKERDTVLDIPYVANIQAYKNVEVHARTEGIIEKIFVKEGQFVKKGQPLFQINDSELRIELNKTEASCKSAEADAKVALVEVERVQILVDRNVITKTELELAKAKYNAQIAKLEVAKADRNAVIRRLSYTTINSPFDGVIDRIPLKEGSLASSNSLLTTISDISSVNAYFNISEKEYYQLNQGHESNDIESIQLLLPDGTYYPYKGELHNAESEIDENTGNIAFKATFSNPDRILRHGASGKLLITKPLHKAKLVPQKAVFEIQDKNYIFLVGADNIVKMKNIEVSQRIADFYVVTSPINEQDRIVYEGIQTLREGEKINPKLITIQ